MYVLSLVLIGQMKISAMYWLAISPSHCSLIDVITGIFHNASLMLSSPNFLVINYHADYPDPSSAHPCHDQGTLL